MPLLVTFFILFHLESMKKIIPVLLLECLLICSCSFNNSEEIVAEIASKKLIRKLRSEAVSSLPPIILQPKLRNGLEPTVNRYGRTTAYHTYINDTLYGPYYNRSGIGFDEEKTSASPKDGFYKSGKKHGHFNNFNERGYIESISYYQEDELLWDAQYVYNRKLFDFVHTFEVYADSVQVNVPHPNGNSWYDGTFINKKPTGIHKIRRDDGSKKSELSFEDWTISYYNADEVFQRKNQIRSSWTVFLGR